MLKKINYPNNDLPRSPKAKSSVDACAAACLQDPACGVFVLDETNANCFLKSARSAPIDPGTVTAGVPDSVVMVGWCWPDSSVVASSAYPDCITECTENANCAAVRFVANTSACELLSK